MKIIYLLIPLLTTSCGVYSLTTHSEHFEEKEYNQSFFKNDFQRNISNKVSNNDENSHNSGFHQEKQIENNSPLNNTDIAHAKEKTSSFACHINYPPSTIYNPAQLNFNTDIAFSIPQNDDNDKILGVFTGSDIFAIIAILVSLYSMYRTNNDLRKNKVESINEGYWLREIIIPSVMEPVMELSKNAKDKYINLNSDLAVFFSSYYVGENDKMLNSIIVAQAISTQLYDNLRDLILDLDDELGGVSNAREVELVINAFVKKIVDRIKLEQVKQVTEIN